MELSLRELELLRNALYAVTKITSQGDDAGKEHAELFEKVVGEIKKKNKKEREITTTTV